MSSLTNLKIAFAFTIGLVKPAVISLAFFLIALVSADLPPAFKYFANSALLKASLEFNSLAHWLAEIE